MRCYFWIHTFSVVYYHGPGFTEHLRAISANQLYQTMILRSQWVGPLSYLTEGRSAMSLHLEYATARMDFVKFVQKVCRYSLIWAIDNCHLIPLSSLLRISITLRGSSYCTTRRHLSSSRLLKSPSGSKSPSTTMATRDTTMQSDISKMKMEPDGSFKRVDASFRNTIAKGSQFEPEIGGF